MTYPKSRRVVLGHSPSSGVEPYFGAVSSSSSRRLDQLYHDWRDQAVGANVWWQPQDRDLPDMSHLDEIVNETECEIIVALGTVVAALLLGPKLDRRLLEWDEVHWSTDDGFRTIRVMPLPHPSGLNRFYNNVDNRVQASVCFREAMLS